MVTMLILIVIMLIIILTMIIHANTNIDKSDCAS